MPQLKRIRTDQLQLGMFVHELCGSWMDHPFWKTRFLLRRLGDLQRIVDSGIAEVWIDAAKGLDVPGGVSEQQAQASVEHELALTLAESAPAPEIVPAPTAVESGDEFERARALCDGAREQVQALFADARLGRAIDAKACLPMVEEIRRSVHHDPGALISVARLKLRDEYTYMHSVAVCALMVALARQLQLPEDQVHEAGLAGLLHDLGKARVPLEVLNKPGALTDAEFARMKSHPELGHALLVDSGLDNAIALDVCLHHHERIDGSGYPHRLAGDAITLFARMGAVCDVYDAVTSNRPYKGAWDPGEALRKMAQWKGHFDTSIFHAFVKTVGIYPVGSLVRLESQRLGVVLGPLGESLLAPRVKVFHCARNRTAIGPQVVDLAAAGCADRIAGVESPREWGFEGLEALWLEGAT